MVRACLRVLKHHGVIAVVDMFGYSNRYECTNQMFARLNPKLLEEAVEFVVKRRAALAQTRSATWNRSGSHSPATSRDQDVAQCHSDSTEPIGGGSYPRMASAGSSHRNAPIADLLQRQEIEDVKTAISEFCSACGRHWSIGDVWIALVTQQNSPKTTLTSTAWRKMFHLVDHRRLITFGVVYGLLRRAHNFPLLLRATPLDEWIDGDVDNSTSQRDHDSRWKNPAGPQHHVKHEQQQRRQRELVRRAAQLLDGTHCDDEFVCALEMPLIAIFDLFPSQMITSIYSTVKG
jgi:Nitrogen permease regulator 2